FEAMRVPRLRHVDVTVPRLGRELDGLRVAIVTDTHFGPINRSRWVAGVVDATASGSGLDGHGADLDAALTGADPATPVLLLAHQPKQVRDAVAAGVDLQISGHTHGGQIWPFNFLVRLDQPVVHGLSAHGDRTQ